MRAAVREQRVHNAVGGTRCLTGLAPDSTLAIDRCQQRNRGASERAGSRASHVPEGADLADEGVAKRFGAYVDSALSELGKDLVTAFAQVLDAAGGMFTVPVIANGKI